MASPRPQLIAAGLEENVSLTALLMNENAIGDAGALALAAALQLNQTLKVPPPCL